MGIVSCAAAQAHRHPITLASHPQLPIFIFTTSFATSLPPSCKSASPRLFFSQRLPAPGSCFHCFDPLLPRRSCKVCTLFSIAMGSFDLESAGAHARSLFDVGQGHLMGGDFEPGRLGAWAAAHETIPKSCFGISV